MLLTRQDILFALAQGAIALVAALLMAAAFTRVRYSLARPIALASPIIASAIGIYLSHGIGSAIALVMAGSVGAMLLGIGSAVLMSNQRELNPPPAGPLATLVLPLGVVLLLAGFSVHMTPAGLVGLLIVGILAVDLARNQPAEVDPDSRKSGVISLVVAMVAALAAGGLVGFSTSTLLAGLGKGLPILHADAIVIATILPMVLFPLLGLTVSLGSSNKLASAAHISSTLVCLLLGIALPAFVLVDYLLTARESDFARLAGLPPVSWRLDAPLLIMAGFAMLGIRLGFLRTDRWMALLFIMLYGLYVLTGIVMRIG